MILANGTNVQLKAFGGTLSQFGYLQGLATRICVSNAVFFGKDKSWPEGYQAVVRAWVPPFAESGQIAAQFALDLDMTADMRGLGNMAASLAVDVDMTANANLRANAFATFAVDVDMTAGLGATANMAAVFDLVGRPSAVDIAQEVWNGFTVENGLAPAEVLRILLAVAAGKTSIVGSGPTTVTFRDTADTKDRVVASMTGSERDTVTLDGS